MDNDRLNTTDAPSADELAQFRAWQASQTTAPTAAEAPPEFDDSAYTFAVGQIVRKGTGYALVISRAPASKTTATVTGQDAQGQNILSHSVTAVPGYVVAELGQANDTPASAEDLGLGDL